MQPTYSPLAQIFGTQTRHLVPLFQRPYVWSKDDQWEPLWDDVQDVAERVFAGQKPVAGHFLGTVVLEQIDTPTGAVNRREIIDGQQRLTTLQILLHSAQLAFGALDSSDPEVARAVQIESARLGALTTNPPGYDPAERYKVWPTNDDRAAFREVMDATHVSQLAANDSRMGEALLFFSASVQAWLARGDPAKRVPALSAALKDHLRLIVLDLDEQDEPQAIFETLNAHGTPLLPADLIKNWLLWQFTQQDTDPQVPYDKYWAAFDREPEYWREKVGAGHAARARIDAFLQSWLVRREGSTISPTHLYDRFLRYATRVGSEGIDATTALMAEIALHGKMFRQIDEPSGLDRFAKFLSRLKALDVGVFQPLLLALMHRSGSNAADRDASARVLESYLVRRMVCVSQTRGYAALAIELLRTVDQAPADQTVAAALQGHLMGLDGSLKWPSDVEFRLAWRDRSFYGFFRRQRVVMILQALEEYLHTAPTMGEPIVAFDYSKLTIEHILPQKWQENWPFEGTEVERAGRDRKLHGIGNLTLVSSALNPHMSNAAWRRPPDKPTAHSKYEALQAHTLLRLNTQLLSGWPERWDEAGIDARAELLFNVACQIWPAGTPTP